MVGEAFLSAASARPAGPEGRAALLRAPGPQRGVPGRCLHLQHDLQQGGRHAGRCVDPAGRAEGPVSPLAPLLLSGHHTPAPRRALPGPPCRTNLGSGLPGALWRLHRLPQCLPCGLRREPHPVQVPVGTHLPCHRDRLHQRPGNDTCHCLNATVCEVFRKGYVMLYPFSTEYCLICCAVVFVMWKNVGRRLTPNSGTHPRCEAPFHLHGVIFGPLLGLLVLVAGVCVFVLFQIEASGPTIAQQYFTLYYAFYVAVLPAMSLACLAGTAIHGLEERELDTLKNPTRSLDVVLLMGAALGQMGIAYFSIVAIVATRPHELLNRLILAYSLLLILQHIAQNLFIIEGLHRRPLPVGVLPEAKGEADEGPRRGSLLELSQGLRRVSLAYIHSYSHLNWKRRVLKEIALFLILCNITLWMMPAFGIHPEFENGLEKDFYGYQTWFTIVNFGLPLGVFYRMHSVGGLVEVYLGA
ncbi:proton channel OTOP3 isoform X2 [Erinaceus europaeus]|uniref:Proton channel OTOP3 isoform X2 n=1 Tax=Erinaceus europaeus TaxID=9365 RepID=A0ABM3YCA2_ERIEU|nr:proton channel OTOP3 isoform X2 [Erinaceus europaeus]